MVENTRHLLIDDARICLTPSFIVVVNQEKHEVRLSSFLTCWRTVIDINQSIVSTIPVSTYPTQEARR